jgi:hypothetical protein
MKRYVAIVEVPVAVEPLPSAVITLPPFLNRNRLAVGFGVATVTVLDFAPVRPALSVTTRFTT